MFLDTVRRTNRRAPLAASGRPRMRCPDVACLRGGRRKAEELGDDGFGGAQHRGDQHPRCHPSATICRATVRLPIRPASPSETTRCRCCCRMGRRAVPGCMGAAGRLREDRRGPGPSRRPGAAGPRAATRTTPSWGRSTRTPADGSATLPPAPSTSTSLRAITRRITLPLAGGGRLGRPEPAGAVGVGELRGAAATGDRATSLGAWRRRRAKRFVRGPRRSRGCWRGLGGAAARRRRRVRAVCVVAAELVRGRLPQWARGAVDTSDAPPRTIRSRGSNGPSRTSTCGWSAGRCPRSSTAACCRGSDGPRAKPPAGTPRPPVSPPFPFFGSSPRCAPLNSCRRCAIVSAIVSMAAVGFTGVLAFASAVLSSCVSFDGGGRWRVYATRLVSTGRTVQVVRDRLLAEGLREGEMAGSTGGATTRS